MKQLDQKWQAWIQENLIKGCDAAHLAQIIADNFSVNLVQASALVSQVAASPISRGVDNKVLERRNWSLRALDQMARINPDCYKLERIELAEFSDFLRQYYATNTPVIFKQAFSHWPTAQWTPDTLLEKVAEKEVEVQFGRESNPRFELDSLKHKKNMAFSEYHKLVMETSSSNDFYMTANNAAKNAGTMAELYGDMLNFSGEYFDTQLHGSRSFIWFGPKGNYTPLHHDETNNMFLQVYGRKKFILLPPAQTPYLYNETAVFSPLDFRQPDFNQYPLAREATPIEVILEPGETLFIPVGWWHQVESLDVSISITMTNFNAPNSFPM